MERIKSPNNQGIQRRFSNQGFAIINLLLLISLILVVIVSTYLFTSHIEVQSHFYQICRTELEQTQTMIGKEIYFLISLNPTIINLKLYSAYLKISIIMAAANLPLQVLLQNLLTKLRIIEDSIVKTQKLLILNMQRTISIGLSHTKINLQVAFNRYKWNLRNLTSLSSLNIQNTKISIPAVEPTDKKDSLSTYKTMTDFERKQQLYISWNYNSLIESKFKTYVGLNKIFKGKCIFSIEERTPWKAIQIAVR